MMKKMLNFGIGAIIVLGVFAGLITLTSKNYRDPTSLSDVQVDEPRESLKPVGFSEMAVEERIKGFVEPVKPLSVAETSRSVLVELFTSTGCSLCQAGEGALDRLADEYYRSELSILEYHTDATYGVPGNNDRRLYYGSFGYPTAMFDGIDRKSGGNGNPDDPTIYNIYKTKIDARLPVPSPVTITVTGDLNATAGTITAKITAIDDIPSGLSNLTARFVVYDDHNYTVIVGGREYRMRFTVVENLPEEPITIAKEESLEFIKTFTLDPSWDVNKLGVVAFVQSDTTKEILQTTSLNLSASSSKVDLALTSSDISFSNPSPYKGDIVTIGATVQNVGTIATSSNVYVSYFDGDPGAGGTQIGSTQNAGLIGPDGTANVQVNWDTSGLEGDHDICVFADMSNDIFEPENENNNIAPKSITVLPGPSPHALSWSPTGNEISRTTNFVVQWNETMDWDSVNASFSYTDGAITLYASDGTFTHDPTTNTSTFNPSIDLSYGALYTVMFNTSATDSDGYPLNQDLDGTGGEIGQDELSWAFTTTVDDPPSIETWEPGGTSAQTYTQGDTITITWSATDDNPLPANPINITYGESSTWHIIATYEDNDGTFYWDTSSVPCPGTYLINISVQDSLNQNTFDNSNYSFDVICPDTKPPTITNLRPTLDTTTNDNTVTISATFSDSSGIDISSVFLIIDGVDVTSSATITESGLTYTPTEPFTDGIHTIYLEVRDNSPSQNKVTKTSTFTVDTSDLALPMAPGFLEEYWWLILLAVIAAITVIVAILLLGRKKKKSLTALEDESSPEHEVYNQQLNENPEDLDTRFYKALELKKMGKHKEALRTLHEVTKLNSQYPHVWTMKAELFREMGDEQNAALCDTKAQELAPVTFVCSSCDSSVTANDIKCPRCGVEFAQ